MSFLLRMSIWFNSQDLLIPRGLILCVNYIIHCMASNKNHEPSLIAFPNFFSKLVFKHPSLTPHCLSTVVMAFACMSGCMWMTFWSSVMSRLLFLLLYYSWALSLFLKILAPIHCFLGIEATYVCWSSSFSTAIHF